MVRLVGRYSCLGVRVRVHKCMEACVRVPTSAFVHVCQ